MCDLDMRPKSPSEINALLRDLDNTANAIEEGTQRVPESFRTKVIEAENDLFHDANRDATISDFSQRPDIVSAVFKLANIKTFIPRARMLIRMNRNRTRLDFEVCSECKGSSTLEYVRRCSTPAEALQEMLSGCGDDQGIAVLFIRIIIQDDQNRCPARGDGRHANMLLIDKAKRIASVSEPNGFSEAQKTFYLNEFRSTVMQALNTVRPEWRITDVVLDQASMCGYNHGRLCRYANVLTYVFPATRNSTRAFASHVVRVLRKMYTEKGRLPPAAGDSGRAGGGIALGIAGAMRHRRVLRYNIQGISKSAIRRLARRGGVKRISGLIYEETRGVLRVFLENVIRDAVTYTEHARRRTVTAPDVIHALRRQGRTLYGFGGE